MTQSQRVAPLNPCGIQRVFFTSTSTLFTKKDLALLEKARGIKTTSAEENLRVAMSVFIAFKPSIAKKIVRGIVAVFVILWTEIVSTASHQRILGMEIINIL